MCVQVSQDDIINNFQSTLTFLTFTSRIRFDTILLLDHPPDRTLQMNCIILSFSPVSRNGTPRQPLLVPLARSRLDLPPGTVPPAALEGLEGYSHCWLLYVFHANTDLQRLWQADPFRGLRAKVNPFPTCREGKEEGEGISKKMYL